MPKVTKNGLIVRIILLFALVFFILVLNLGCGKQEKASTPPPVAVEQPVPPPPVYQKTDEHLKLSESFRRLASLYKARIESTYAVFNNWPNIREDLANWSASRAGRVLYELLLPDGRSYSIPEDFHGKLMVVFESRALAEKFVAENRLAVEKSVSVKEFSETEDEQ